MPLISIIVPVYNAEEYIKDCLDSLVSQDIGIDNLEILIIDDCSPDNSILIAEEYYKKYKNVIRIIRHKKNKGLGGARNTGLENATGRYIAFLDSDDFLDSNVFSLAAEIMEQDSKIDIFLYAYEYYSKSNKQYLLNPSAKLFPLNKTISQYEIVQYPELMHAMSACNKVYRKTLLDVLPKFPGGHFEDALFSIQGYLEAEKIHITDRTTYFYRKREVENTSIMDNYLERKNNFFDHLSVNEHLYQLTLNYPHMAYAIHWFNVRSWSAFLYEIFHENIDLSIEEKREIFKRTKNIYQNIDVNNLYYDGINDKTKRYIQIVQTSHSYEEASKKVYNGKPQIVMSKIKRKLKENIPPALVPLAKKVKSTLKALRKNSHQIILTSREKKLKKEIDNIIKSEAFSMLPEKIWLLSERGNEAKDNAYALFKYIRKNHPEIPAYYVMTQEESNVYETLNELGNVIDKNSHQHKMLFLKSKYLICTHARGTITPWNLHVLDTVYPAYQNKKYVFLQHGVIHNDVSKELNKKTQNFDLFICGAKPEYDYIVQNFGYSEDEVKYTGLARYDNLHSIKTKKQILLMPTWRAEICQPSWINERIVNDSIFLTSEYYKTYQALLNSQLLSTLLEENNIELIFYPHYEVQQYLKYFSTRSQNIKIASKNDYDVQTLLIESKLLITDYSSVFFDFGYMQKPSIFYQFDEKTFFDTHYKRGYFNYKTDGFGIVCNYQERLLKEIEKVINTDFLMNEKYAKRVERFFPLYDTHNCQRIYNEIVTLESKK